MKKAKETAERICSGKGCFCHYNCGVEKDFVLDPIGSGDICPIAKYNLPESRYIVKDFMDGLATQIYPEDILTVCAECEHTTVSNGIVVFDEDEFAEYCYDCPVKQVSDNIQEAMAEAYM